MGPSGTASGSYGLDTKLWLDTDNSGTIDAGDVQLSQSVAQNALTIQPATIISTQVTITSVGPSLSVSSSYQTLRILGTGFTPSSTLSFSFNGNSAIASTASRLHYKSATEIDYDFGTGTVPGSWSVHVLDPAGTSNAFGFSVSSATTNTNPPTAALSFPANGGSIGQSILNADGVIQISFADSGSGFDPSSITNSASKITLSGSAAAGVTLVHTPPVATNIPSTYQYAFTGSFGTGPVTVNFPAGTFTNLAGTPNTASTQSFAVTSTQAQTGAVTVSISPQAAINAGAQWCVDGQNYRNNGDVVSGLTVGTHTISFKPISGWATPANQSIAVLAGQTTPDTGTYTQSTPNTCSLYVTSVNGSTPRNPQASIYAVGTQVTVTAIPDTGYHFTGWSGAVTSSQNPLAITLNGDTYLTANYAVGDSTHGNLMVNITPQSAVAAGAIWSIDGGKTWYYPAENIQNLAVGSYTVQFYPLGGFTKPANQSISVAAGQTTTITGAYIPDPQFGSVQVGIGPSAAATTGAQWRMDGGAWQSAGNSLANIAVGSHVISFSAVSGWSAPMSQTISVTVNQATVVNANYTPPVGQPIISSISPPTGPLAGGTQVVIQGVNFAPGATVSFGGVTATNVIVDSATQIRATTPARTSYGSVAVVVTTSGGTATNSNGFLYVAPLGHGIELAGHVGGAASAVIVSGAYAYLGEGSGLVILNVSNPNNPSVVGRLTLPGQAENFAISGQYLYGADDKAGLQVVDVSNPSSPQLRGFYSLPGNAFDVTVLGGRAYLADATGGLQILDLTNPIAPTLVDAVPLGDDPWRLALAVINGKVLAFLGGDSTVQILDVIDPTHPAAAGVIAVGDDVQGIKVSGNRAYVATAATGLLIYDISSLTAPALLGTFAGSAQAVAYSAGKAYISWFGHATTVDVSNPGNPTELATVSGWCSGMFLSGSLLYVAGSGITILDTSNPAALTTRGSYANTLNNTQEVAVSGNAAYILGSVGTAVASVDVSNPGAPALQGVLTWLTNGAGSGYGQKMVTVGSRAYVTSNVGMVVLDISDPTNPRQIGCYSSSHSTDCYGIAAVGTTIYVTGDVWNTNHPQLIVLDASNPSAINLVGSVELSATPNIASGVQVRGSFAYVIVGQKLDVVDLSNPAAPRLRGSYTAGSNLSSYDFALSTDGNYAFCATLSSLLTIDIRNPDAPALVTTCVLPDRVWSIRVSGSHAYVADSSAGIQVLDVTDPTNPVIIASYDTPMVAYDVAVSGNYLYVADASGGLQVLHMLDTTPPTVTITNPTAISTVTTTTGTINLGGAASDDRQLGQVIWSNNRGGSGTAAGNSSWLATGVVLQPGANVLTVTAYDAAGNVGTDTLTVTYNPVQQSQTITFPSLGNCTYTDPPVALSATASSGLPVWYSILSGPAVITGGAVVANGAGTVVVQASQAGNMYFNAAGTVTQSFTVSPASQVISLAAPSGMVFGQAPFVESAVSTSGLPVDLSVVSGPAVVSNGLGSLTGAGIVVLQGAQSGNVNYSAATPATVTFSVTQANQAISFGPLNYQVFGDSPFPVNARTNSGLLVGFTVVSGPATFSGNVLTLTGSGNVTIQASQSGNANYSPAQNVLQSFTVYNTPPSVFDGAYLFYKNSAFDLGSHDNAIASNKVPLLSGATASFANYSSYSRGINGLMIDIAGMAGTFALSDLTFKVGNNNSSGGWNSAPAPLSVITRPGQGIGGSARVEMTWADNAIANEWLQVTVKGGVGSSSGLPADDVFYFGNAIGEAGNDPASARVNAIDELAARAAPIASASITNPYDYNRDGLVNIDDQVIARTHVTCFLNELQLLTPPAAAVAPAITGVQDSDIASSVSTTPTLTIDSALIPVLVVITPTENSGQVGGNALAALPLTNPVIITPSKMVSAPKPLPATPLVGLAPIGSSAKAITSTLTARTKAISKRQPVKSLFRSSFSKLPIFQRLF